MTIFTALIRAEAEAAAEQRRHQQPVLILHNVSLDTETCTLHGPRGMVHLQPQLFRIAERLFRRPQALVPETALISAMYPDPDIEPDSASVICRMRVTTLRQVLLVLSNDRVLIRTDRDAGWALGVRS